MALTLSGSEIAMRSQYEFTLEYREVGSVDTPASTKVSQFTFPPKMYLVGKAPDEVMIEWTPTYSPLYKYKVARSKVGSPSDTDAGDID